MSPRAQKALDKVGVPPKARFKPDPFQLEAVRKVLEGDVLVSAPTGSGKTWIALKAIDRCFTEGGRVWYASPLKALTNSVYHQFQDHFGPESVGILTGDRKENPTAPILVGTTEVFRNHLYDAMHTGENLELDLLIIDEAHYLGDPDRGMVWEELLIYLPSRIRLLLLSATISNAYQIAEWMRSVRGTEVFVVRADVRPVPLFPLFLFPDGELTSLLEKGRLSGRIRAFQEGRKGDRFRLPPLPVPLWRVADMLREVNLLPAIFFLKSRSDCNFALSQCPAPAKEDRTKRRLFRERLNELLSEMPFLQNHPHLPDLRRSRMAAHHGGELPYWKLLVETLMKEGLLDAIFATTTVAAGVNFPARTVAFLNSDRFDGRSFKNLTSTELHQMLGRAGRRGMDRIGFALVLPGPYQRLALVADLLKSEPEPIVSQMRVTFSMALNLLLSHAPEEIRELLKQSLLVFQGSADLAEMERKAETLIRELEPDLEDPLCGSIREALHLMERRKELLHREATLKRLYKTNKVTWFRRSHLVRGRVFLSPKHRLFCVAEPPAIEKGVLFRAIPVTSSARSRKGRLKTKEFDLMRIGPLMDRVVDLPEDLDPDEIDSRLRAVADEVLMVLPSDTPLHGFYAEKRRQLQDDLRQTREALKEIPCKECEQRNRCHGRQDVDWRSRCEQASGLLRQIDEEKERIWLAFKRRLDFLQETKFADTHGRLTHDGLWAARLRLDQPLLIAEGIRKRSFPDHDPALLTGLTAVFVWEREADADLHQGWIQGDEELHAMFQRLIRETADFRDAMEQKGFSTPRFQYRAACTLFLWASGATWDETRTLSGLDEGDLAMVIYRTADNLRQIAGLVESHPVLAATAGQASRIILREPVLPY